MPELDLSAGTGFQQAVWRALMQIPYGATQTYGELALRIGNPDASRAVGTACGRNPVPVLVPCHRVVASGGKLGGFSAGLSWKRTLLNLKQVGLEWSLRALVKPCFTEGVYRLQHHWPAQPGVLRPRSITSSHMALM